MNSVTERGIRTKKGPSGVTFAFIDTPSGYLVKVRTKNQWHGVSGLFPDVPTDVEFVETFKVNLTFATWPTQEAEVAPPPAPKKNRKRYGREDNRTRNWKRSYRENRRAVR